MKRFSVLLVLFLFLPLSCERVQDSNKVAGENGGGKNEKMPSPIAEGVTQLSAATVAITSAKETHHFTVEIAESDEERAQGLMNREALGEKQGMWFIFPEDVQENFWMKDTLIPLDIIFVNSEMKIVDIIISAVPESTELLSASDFYRYVLEVRAGTAERLSIKIGDKVEFRVGPK